MPERYRLMLQVAASESDVDVAELEELALQLRADLLEFGVSTVERQSAGPAPEGARSVELIAAGVGFLITGLSTAASAAQIAQFLQDWRKAHPRRAKVALNLSGAGEQAAASRRTGRRSALLIANATYRDPALSQLRSPVQDTQELKRVLDDPRIGGFDVELLIDADEAVVRRRVAVFFADRSAEDVLLLHFSCHGVKDQRGRLYLAATDTELSSLAATGLPAAFVADRMSETASRGVVLILDCCYSGAFARGAAVRGDRSIAVDEEFSQGTGRIVLTASSATEYSFEGDQMTPFEARPSVFSGALVAGLETGAADLDGDGDISVDELYEYAYREVRRRGAAQEPRKWTFGMSGPLVLARSVLPARLPEMVLADLASDRVVLKLEAIKELHLLQLGGKPALREAATAQLIQLRDHDDSVRVRTAAAAALGDEPPAGETVETPKATREKVTPPTEKQPGAKAPTIKPPKEEKPPAKQGPVTDTPAPLPRRRRRILPVSLVAAGVVTVVVLVFGMVSGWPLFDGGGGNPGGQTVTLAFFGDLNADIAPYAESARKAAEMAIAEYSQSNPAVKVRLVPLDSGWRDTIERQNVAGVIGPSTSPLTSQAMPVLEAKGIPAITVSATSPGLRSNGWRFWHRLVSDDYDQLGQLASYLDRKHNPKRAVTVDLGTGQSADFAGHLADDLKRGGAVVQQDRIKPGASDADELAARVKGNNTDVVVQFSSPAETVTVHKRLQAQGVKPLFVAGFELLNDPEFYNQLRNWPDDALIISSFLISDGSSKDSVKAFDSRFRQRYGKQPGPYAYEAFDAATLFLMAVQAGKITPTDINTYFSTVALAGLSRTVQFKPNGEITNPPVYLYRTRNGALVAAGMALS